MDPATSWNTVLSLTVIANLGVAALALLRSNRAQKREVTLLEDVVSQRQFRDLTAAFTAEQKNTLDRIESLRREIKADVIAIHNRINEVFAAVAKLQGRLEQDLQARLAHNQNQN